jgi:NAD+ kinase
MAQNFRTIALAGKYNSREVGESLHRLAAFLRQRGHEVLVSVHTAEMLRIDDYPASTLTEISRRADLAIVLGGDGTMLNIARTLGGAGVPLVGVNQGRLGFLTDVSIDTMFDTLGEMLDGQYLLEERLLLDASVRRDGREELSAQAFNDVVIEKGSQGRLIEFEIYIDGQFVYSQRADGLVVATPTGSTAYALSAGGPLLHPSLEAVALVPICPHTLSARPIAVNSLSAIEVRLIHADDAGVHFDGQRHQDLRVGDKIVISRARKNVRLLHPLGHSYYDTLRQKLRWGEKLT